MILLIAVTEVLCAAKGSGWRAPLYWGGAAGIAINLLAVPFVWKIAVLPAAAGRDKAFWKWWGLSFFVRLLSLGGFAFGLCSYFSGQEHVTLLAMMGAYLPGMFVESAWLGRRLVTADTEKKHA